MKKLFVLIGVCVFAFGCRSMQGPTATARLEPRSGSNTAGTVVFTELADGSVRVEVDLTGATTGIHGFHIHETGDCSAPDATSAGAHFNPSGAPHGSMSTATHAGDFGNLTADSSGRIDTEFSTRSITVAPGNRSVLGKAVLLHASPDDLTSQPSGNSGARVACGVAVAQ